MDDLSTYKYCLREGTLPLLAAAVDWYASRYGVRLEARHALSLIGSQEGLAHLLMAVADPGDGVLMLPIGWAGRARAAWRGLGKARARRAE